MNVLELFAGTGSVGKVCEEIGWNVISVDLILPATHEVDILEFDYKQYPKDYFSIVWASPPCVFYSALRNTNLGKVLRDGKVLTKERIEKDMEEGDKLVVKALEIINYFNPEVWFLENPQTGRLKNRDIMKGLPYYDVDYCKYCDWGYRKRTRIWTNQKDFTPLICNKDCENMVGIKHRLDCSSIGGGSTFNEKKDLKHLGKGTNRIDRYRIPEDLIKSLFNLI